jgi:hypothetical protein
MGKKEFKKKKHCTGTSVMPIQKNTHGFDRYDACSLTAIL